MSRRYIVIAKEMTTPSTLVLTMQPRMGSRPMRYLPGQYAAISFKSDHRPSPERCFSMSSSPSMPDYLQFGFNVRGSYTKAALKNIEVGSEVNVDGPFGGFVFESRRDKLTVFLAGGIGITPFMSMIRYATDQRLNNIIALLYTCKTQDDIPFLKDILELAKNNPRFLPNFFITDGPINKLSGLSVARGRITPEIMGELKLNFNEAGSYMVCGPPAFSQSAVETLRQYGVPDEKVITEEFSQNSHRQKEMKHSWPTQVYFATALALAVGPVVVFGHDVIAGGFKTAKSPAPEQPIAPSQNSRQNDINSELRSLSGGLVPLPNGQSSDTTPATTGDNTTTSTATPPPSASSTSSGGGGGGTSSSSGGGASSSGGGTSSSSTSSSSGQPQPPPPPPAVAPALAFTASSTTINAGYSAQLGWSINSNATAPVTCSASGGWSGVKPTSGSQVVKPASTTTYYLSCSNSAGTSSKSVTITVIPACVSSGSKVC